VDDALPTTIGRRVSNPRARASLATGILAALAVPGGVALAAYSPRVDLVHAAAAIPLAIILGLAAIAFSRGARRHSEMTLGRVGGTGVARAGSILGALGLYLAAMALLSIGFFGLLLLFD
jgi:hypothetical protein